MTDGILALNAGSSSLKFSLEYIASVLPRVVVAHLGSGASMCAMHSRQSRAMLLGVSGISSEMPNLLASDSPRAGHRPVRVPHRT